MHAHMYTHTCIQFISLANQLTFKYNQIKYSYLYALFRKKNSQILMINKRTLRN